MLFKQRHYKRGETEKSISEESKNSTGNSFAILAPNLAQAIADFSNSGQGFNAIKDSRQNIFVLLSRLFEFDEGGFRRESIPAMAQRPHALDLASIGHRSDAQSY